MNMHLVPVGEDSQSSFDTIKNIDPETEAEYWSARNLMPLLGYDRWENFSQAIDRAKIAAEVQGQDVEKLFRGITKKGAGRPQQDYELARFAYYLVAMNGDPRKPEIASAMSYFAIKTREAETRSVVTPELTRLELLQIAMNAEEERLALESKKKELEPKAEAYDNFIDATGKYNIGNVAKMFGKGQNWLFRELRNKGVLIAKGAMRNTPYAHYMHHFEANAHQYERSNGEQGVSYTTYVQPSGIDFIRKKLGLASIDPAPQSIY